MWGLGVVLRFKYFIFYFISNFWFKKLVFFLFISFINILCQICSFRKLYFIWFYFIYLMWQVNLLWTWKLLCCTPDILGFCALIHYHSLMGIRKSRFHLVNLLKEPTWAQKKMMIKWVINVLFGNLLGFLYNNTIKIK